MPRVPTYDTPQVAPTPLQAPRVLADESGAQLQKLGNAAQGAGAELAGLAVKMQERENADAVFRAETALKDDLIKYEQEVRKSRRGRFAQGLTADTEKWWEERVKHHEAALGNGAQRQIFQRRAAGLRTGAISGVSRFEAVEMERSHDESWTANKAATVSAAAATPTPENVANARKEIDRLNRYQAARKGWTPEQLEAANRADLTNMHKQVIQGLARTDPVAAKAYFDEFKGEIDGAQHAEIGAFAERVSAAALGEQAAGTVWAELGPKNDSTPVELDKMEARIRESLKGNEPAIDEAIKGLRERVQAHKDARRERAEAQEARVNEMILNGASLAQIRRSPEFLALPPEQARRIAESLERLNASRSARAAAEAARAESAERREELRRNRLGIEARLRVSDPQVLASMTRDQVINLGPTIGWENTQDLVRKWDDLQKPEKLGEATIDNDMFKAIVLEHGFSPNEKNMSEEDKDRLLRLKDHVERVIDIEQRTGGKKLTREQKREIMQREIDNKVLVEKFFGLLHDERPAAVLTADEAKNAFVIVNGKEVKLSTIPAEYDREARLRLRQRGVRPTEQLVAEMWVMDKNAWRK